MPDVFQLISFEAEHQPVWVVPFQLDKHFCPCLLVKLLKRTTSYCRVQCVNFLAYNRSSLQSQACTSIPEGTEQLARRDATNIPRTHVTAHAHVLLRATDWLKMQFYSLRATWDADDCAARQKTRHCLVGPARVCNRQRGAWKKKTPEVAAMHKSGVMVIRGYNRCSLETYKWTGSNVQRSTLCYEKNI